MFFCAASIVQTTAPPRAQSQIRSSQAENVLVLSSYPVNAPMIVAPQDTAAVVWSSVGLAKTSLPFSLRLGGTS